MEGTNATEATANSNQSPKELNGDGDQQEEVFEDAVGAPALSVADTILIGQELRNRCKKRLHDPLPAKMPKIAQPGSKAPPIAKKRKMTKAEKKKAKRDMKNIMSCMRRNRTVMSQRMNMIALPTRRRILNMWRDHADKLPADTINRFKGMLEEGRAYNTTEAYDFFMNAKKHGHIHRCKSPLGGKRKKGKKAESQAYDDYEEDDGDGEDGGGGSSKKRRKSRSKSKDRSFGKNREKQQARILAKKLESMTFNRRACVLFAHNVQKLLAVPEHYHLSGGMLRLSNVIMEEMCCFMGMRIPPRCSQDPQDSQIVDICDKIAVWVDQILVESEGKLLDMEDEDDFDSLFELDSHNDDASGDGESNQPSTSRKQSKLSHESKKSNATQEIRNIDYDETNASRPARESKVKLAETTGSEANAPESVREGESAPNEEAAKDN